MPIGTLIYMKQEIIESVKFSKHDKKMNKVEVLFRFDQFFL